MMLCWGEAASGQLGVGAAEKAACGGEHSLFLLNDGSVYTCGSNSCGQLGHDRAGILPELVGALDAQKIAVVSCGRNHSLAVNELGQVFAWGAGGGGQLGLGTPEEVVRVPRLIKKLCKHRISQVMCGNQHCIALSKDGQLFTWGQNSNGQLGLGKGEPSTLSPQPLKSLMGVPVAQISAGGDHSFAVSLSGAVFGWGKNNAGQLGLNDEQDRAVPCHIKFLRSQKVVYISCGDEHTAALTKDGGLFTFGNGSRGQLGHDSINNEPLPRRVVELMGTEVSQIACGRHHTLAFVPSSGLVYAFGCNAFGQLGTHSTVSSKTPLPIRSIQTFSTSLVFSSGDFENLLIPQLPCSPPDVEAMRIYLILSECPALQDSKNYISLTIPLAMAILRLDANPSTYTEIDLNVAVYLISIRSSSDSFFFFFPSMQVIFDGEEAVDAGGVTKEFFLLLLKELMDPVYGMFTQYSDSNLLWFSDKCFVEHNWFHLIGIICGLAIYNSTVVDLHFPLVLYKKLLGVLPTLEDLKELSPTEGRSLQQLLDYVGDDIEEMFCLNFAVSFCLFAREVGLSCIVMNSYLRYVFSDSVQEVYSAFSSGFLKVCGGKILQLFQPSELMAMVVGNNNYNWEEMEKNAVYKGEYSASHPTVRMFWEVFHEFPLEKKKQFLLFLTGSDRIPIHGMASLRIVIQSTSAEEHYLPVAHTCYNLLDMPRYQTKETLHQRLTQAVEQYEGFSLV
uniref:HECT domain-containing protein n=1 Tax=Denticeps clupeoides TaxID=299321 RepID=A0AAY4APN6_9TELE